MKLVEQVNWVRINTRLREQAAHDLYEQYCNSTCEECEQDHHLDAEQELDFGGASCLSS